MRHPGWLLVVALVIGGLVGTLMVRDPGYVLIAYGNYSLETSLWAAALVLLLLYLVVRAAASVVAWALRAGGGVREWGRERRRRRARTQLEHGVVMLSEARWAEARRSLLRSVHDSETPVLNYLHAAHAAHELGRPAERDELLQRALSAAPDAEVAVALARARDSLGDGHAAEAATTLQTLQSKVPRHPELLRLLAGAREKLGDWQALLSMLPELRKHAGMSEAEILALAARVLDRAMADAITAGHGPEALETRWNALPKDYRREPALVLRYAAALKRLGAIDAAETLLRKSLERHRDDRLVSAYGRLDAGTRHAATGDRQLQTVEDWLADSPAEPRLLLAAGRICLTTGNLTKARAFLLSAWEKLPQAAETSKQSAPAGTENQAELRAELAGVLGQLHRQLGEHEKSADYFAAALEAAGIGGGPPPAPFRVAAGNKTGEMSAESTESKDSPPRHLSHKV